MTAQQTEKQKAETSSRSLRKGLLVLLMALICGLPVVSVFGVIPIRLFAWRLYFWDRTWCRASLQWEGPEGLAPEFWDDPFKKMSQRRFDTEESLVKSVRALCSQDPEPFDLNYQCADQAGWIGKPEKIKNVCAH